MYARNYSKFSNESFRDDVSIQKWDNNLEDVNDQFNDFLARLEGCVDRHAPIKELNQREKELINKPWITKEIIKLIKKRNRIFKNKKKKADVNTIRTYNLFRNRINQEIKNSKKRYYADYFTEHNNNIKKTWEGIRNIMNNNNISHNVTQLSSNGRMIDDPKCIANKLNNFFVNVGPTTEITIPKIPPDKISPKSYMKARNNFVFIIAYISTEEILEIINHLETKSSGPASIPIKLLKIITDLIIIPLTKIINTSFSTGEYPNKLKIVKVIPIHKGDSKTNVND